MFLCSKKDLAVVKKKFADDWSSYPDYHGAGGIFSFPRIFVIPEIAHRFQAAVLSCEKVLRVVLKGLTPAPAKVHCPESIKSKPLFMARFFNASSSLLGASARSTKVFLCGKVTKL